MNKRAIFVTLTAVLIVGILLIYVVMRAEQSKNLSEVQAQYLKHKLIADYNEDLQDIYLPAMIEQSAKESLRDLANGAPIAPNTLTADLQGRMNLKLGPMKDATLKTISAPFQVTSFGYSVTDVEQLDPFNVKITGTLNYGLVSDTTTFREGSTVRLSNNPTYETIVTIYGLKDGIGCEVMSAWIEDPTSACFLNDIDAGFDCSGINGVCPIGLSGCGSC
jgi:hypothetical protein